MAATFPSAQADWLAGEVDCLRLAMGGDEENMEVADYDTSLPLAADEADGIDHLYFQARRA